MSLDEVNAKLKTLNAEITRLSAAYAAQSLELQELKENVGGDAQFWIDRRVPTVNYPMSEAAYTSIKDYVLYLEEALE